MVEINTGNKQSKNKLIKQTDTLLAEIKQLHAIFFNKLHITTTALW